MASEQPVFAPQGGMASSSFRPDLYEWILVRRSFAFLVDATLILLFTMSGYLLVILLGLITFGLSWLLLGLIFPAVALGYYALTLGSNGSTPGMNALGLILLTIDGSQVGALRAMAHAILFWISVVVLTPLSLLVGLFNERRRLLHDILLDLRLVNRRSR